MREILFRGKRADGGEWVYGSYYGLCRMTNKAGDFGYAHLIRQSNDEPLYRVDPETVGQFTGLYDNKGTRIFEGDIVSSNKRKTWIGRGKVWFDKGVFWCGEREWAKLLRVVCLEDEQAVVIGNIHDNKELLNED